MADAGAPRLQSLYFPFLCTGQIGTELGRTLPEFQGVPGRAQVWLRSALNLAPRDGHLRRAPVVRESVGGGTSFPGGTLTTGSKIIQIHQFMVSPFASQAPPSNRGTTRYITIVVTTTHVLISSLSGQWTAVAPQWTGPGSYAQADFTAYDTFVREFNGDLYIGSGCWHRVVSGPNVLITPAVLKVAGLYRSGTYGDLDYSWVASGGSSSTPTAYGGCERIGGTSPQAYSWNTLCGMEFLQDGRLVLLGSAEEGGVVTTSRVFYSSHLDVTQWNTTPGGWVDVVANHGPAYAMSKLGNSLHVHYFDAIISGEPTGQDDPPLYFRSTAAGAGTPFPHSIRYFEGTTLFVDAHLNLQRFNGQSAQVVSDYLARQIRQEYRNPHVPLGATPVYDVAERLKAAGSFSLDRGRGEYRALFPAGPVGDEGEVLVCAVSPLRQQIGSGEWAMTLRKGTVLSDDVVSDPQSVPAQRGFGPMRRWGSSLVGWVSTSNHPALSVLGDYGAQNSAKDGAILQPYTQGYGTFYFETDDLDFDTPGFDKTISHVTLWVKGDEANDSLNLRSSGALPAITVYASRVGFSSEYLADDLSQTMYPPGPRNLCQGEVPIHFFFPPKAAERWRFLVSVEAYPPEYAMPYIFTRMQIHYQVQGEIEASGRGG